MSIINNNKWQTNIFIFNTIMQQDIELEFVKVEKKDLPKEIQTAAEMFEYEFMIA